LEASAIVLAGGKSLRFGKNKSQVKIGKRSLLEQVIACVSSVCSDIIIVGGELRIPQITGYPKLRVTTDIYPDKGPLGGIYTGLKTSTNRLNLVVAGDMPFLNPDLLRHMLGLADSFDLVVPRVGDLIEPLHAVYTRSCLSPIENMLSQNELRVRALFPLVKTRYVYAKEIEKFDRHHLSFFNVNTKADLARAEAIAGGDLSRDKC
jgi:molybdopterin-guanine dinucleotide biosynthesis protein A